VSKPPYETLNLGFKKEDDKNSVLENYRIFCEGTRYNPANLVASDQVHGAEIYIACAKDRGKGILKNSDITGMDAMITRTRSSLSNILCRLCPHIFIRHKNPCSRSCPCRLERYCK
jgi:copper oxidase (laccase) domain-containing protein